MREWGQNIVNYVSFRLQDLPSPKPQSHSNFPPADHSALCSVQLPNTIGAGAILISSCHQFFSTLKGILGCFGPVICKAESVVLTTSSVSSFRASLLFWNPIPALDRGGSVGG